MHDFLEQLALLGDLGDAGVEHLEGEPLGFADAGDGEADEEPLGGVVQGIELLFADEGEEDEVLEQLAQQHDAFVGVGHEVEPAHVHAGEVRQEQDVEDGAVEVEVGDAGVLQVDIEGVVEPVHHLDVQQLGHVVGVVQQPSEVGLVGLALVGEDVDAHGELFGLARTQ